MQQISNYITVPNSYKDAFVEFMDNNSIKYQFIRTTGLLLKNGQTTFLVTADLHCDEKLKRVAANVTNIRTQSATL